MRLSERCYAVQGLGFYAPWCVNAGFIAGEETTLVVDTGGNSAAAQTIHGYASAVRPGNRIFVVNTEKHFDHIGGDGFFREQGCDVWAHPEAVRTQAEFQAGVEEFNDSIVETARRERREAEAFYHATRLTLPNRHLAGETAFDLGQCEVRVFPTPGHTTSNMSVWVPSERVLFTGDCVVWKFLPNLNSGGPRDWRVWLDSLDAVERLAPLVIVPGHGPIARAGETSDAIEFVRGVLREAIALGRSPTA